MRGKRRGDRARRQVSTLRAEKKPSTVHVAASQQLANERHKVGQEIHPDFRNRGRFRAALTLHPRTRRGSGGGPCGVCWRRRVPTGRDVRSRRCVSPHRRQAAASPSFIRCPGGAKRYYGQCVRTRIPENNSARVNRETVLGALPFGSGRLWLWSAQCCRGAVTRNQVELMQVDTVAAASLPGFAELGMPPRPMEVFRAW